MNAAYLRVIFRDLVVPVIHLHGGPVPVAARSKVWVCGRSLAGIAGSNPARGPKCLPLVGVVCCQVEVSATS